MKTCQQRHCEAQPKQSLFKLCALNRGMKILPPLAGVLFLMACTPTVQVQAPDKPIEINLNVNIEHRIKVEIEKDVQKAIANNKDIF